MKYNDIEWATTKELKEFLQKTAPDEDDDEVLICVARAIAELAYRKEEKK